MDCGCLGHWKPDKKSTLHSCIPQELEFAEGEQKDLAFICTMVGLDTIPPHDECYLFYCFDITLGPSSEVLIWKAEPRVAARVFGGFLNECFDQRIRRYGKEYFPIEIEGPYSNEI